MEASQGGLLQSVLSSWSPEWPREPLASAPAGRLSSLWWLLPWIWAKIKGSCGPFKSGWGVLNNLNPSSPPLVLPFAPRHSCHPKQHRVVFKNKSHFFNEVSFRLASLKFNISKHCWFQLDILCKWINKFYTRCFLWDASGIQWNGYFSSTWFVGPCENILW